MLIWYLGVTYRHPSRTQVLGWCRRPGLLSCHYRSSLSCMLMSSSILNSCLTEDTSDFIKLSFWTVREDTAEPPGKEANVVCLVMFQTMAHSSAWPPVQTAPRNHKHSSGV